MPESPDTWDAMRKRCLLAELAMHASWLPAWLGRLESHPPRRSARGQRAVIRDGAQRVLDAPPALVLRVQDAQRREQRLAPRSLARHVGRRRRAPEERLQVQPLRV